MHAETIKNETRGVLEKIVRSSLADDFYLAGGTGLALSLGHRESIDLDWFCERDFSGKKMKDGLSVLGDFVVESEDEGTLHGTLDQVKITFLRYPYEVLFPLLDFEGAKVADERDIAAMKMDAVSSRGSKKDFIDLYFLLEKYSLGELFEFFEKKFAHLKYNKLHILKSLTFFEDAQDEPMPRMIQEVEWEVVKKKMKQEAKGYLEK